MSAPEAAAEEGRAPAGQPPASKPLVRGVRRLPTGPVLGLSLTILVALIIVSIGTGPIDLSPATVLRVAGHELFGIGAPGTDLDRTVVMELRMPRVLFGVLVGAALAVSGAALQSLFRNPLADPGIIGVSGGASTGAVVAIVVLPPMGPIMSAWIVPLAAFSGGLLATWLIYVLARPKSGSGTARLLLVGIALGSGFAALTGFLTFIADDRQLQSLVFWQMGSLGAISWPSLAVGAPVVAACLIVTMTMTRQLDLLTLGDRQARHLGLNVMAARRLIIILTALLTGTAVAFAGTIGFIGLVVPHIVRIMCGPAHRGLLPVSAAVGAVLIVLADTLSRTIAPPAEIPIGLFTAAMGAPFFLMLILRSKAVRA